MSDKRREASNMSGNTEPDMTEESENPWTVIETCEIYDNPWLRVIEHKVLTPRGTPGIYGVVQPKKLALGILPFTADGQIVLVGQYRFPLSRYSWEIPEGGGDRDDALTSAQRELKEETGYVARHWQEVMRLELSNSISNEEAVAFLAWDLTPGTPAPDETEVLAIRYLRFADAYAMVLDGRIRDAISVATLLKVKALAAADRLPSAIRPFVDG